MNQLTMDALYDVTRGFNPTEQNIRKIIPGCDLHVIEAVRLIVAGQGGLALDKKGVRQVAEYAQILREG